MVVHNPLPPVLSDDFVTCEGLTITFGADVDNVVWTGPDDFESEGQYVTLLNTLCQCGTYVATIVTPFVQKLRLPLSWMSRPKTT